MKNNKLNKREKGITLVALVVTIIVLLILAGVTITVLFGDNGIIVRAERAERITKIETTRERMETAGVATILEGLGKTNINEYFEKLEQEGIIGNKDTNVKDNGDGSYNVTTNEDIIFKVTPLPDEDNTTSIKVEYVGDATGPIIKDIKIEKTTNSIKIEIIGEGIEDATYKYEYKKEGETSWQTSETTGESTYTIENLTEGETYNIIITIETSEGTVTKEINVLMGEIPEETITFTNKQWLGDGTASVVINTTAEGYQLQYQINGIEENGWQDIENGGTVNNLTYPSTVFARLWDGINESEHASASLEDSIPPQAIITLEKLTPNSINVSVEATDSESGMSDSLTYTYYIKLSSEADTAYQAKATEVQNSNYTFTGLAQKTSYDIKVEVKADKAGNPGNAILLNQTTTTSDVKEALDISNNQKIYVEIPNIKSPENPIICNVLYNDSTNGIQLISAGSVEDVTLGVDNDFEGNKVVYNNAITTLNNKAMEYFDSSNANYSLIKDIVSDARCVGSVPTNKNYEAPGMFTSTQSYFSAYNGLFKNGDENYLTDYNKMLELDIFNTEGTYWLNSREAVSHGFNSLFILRHYEDGELQQWHYLCRVDLSLEIFASARTHGLRPVFTLNSATKVVGGSGTSDSPYILGI